MWSHKSTRTSLLKQSGNFIDHLDNGDEDIVEDY